MQSASLSSISRLLDLPASITNPVLSADRMGSLCGITIDLIHIDLKLSSSSLFTSLLSFVDKTLGHTDVQSLLKVRTNCCAAFRYSEARYAVALGVLSGQNRDKDFWSYWSFGLMQHHLQAHGLWLRAMQLLNRLTDLLHVPMSSATNGARKDPSPAKSVVSRFHLPIVRLLSRMARIPAEVINEVRVSYGKPRSCVLCKHSLKRLILRFTLSLYVSREV